MGRQITDADSLDLARQITRNREARRNATRLTREAINQLGVGDTAVIPLPAGQPARRDTYRAVNAVAYSLLGSGSYSLARVLDGVLVARR